MLRLLRIILSTDRKHRRLAVRLALRLLKLVRDVEKVEVYRYSDMLDETGLGSNNASNVDYAAIDEVYSNCEYALDALESAIEDLEYTY